MLYADDLVLVGETIEDLVNRFSIWKRGMEDKGLHVNTGKTKVLISDGDTGNSVIVGKFPCSICIGRELVVTLYFAVIVSIGCTSVVGVSGNLNDDPMFKCKTCTNASVISDSVPKEI